MLEWFVHVLRLSYCIWMWLVVFLLSCLLPLPVLGYSTPVQGVVPRVDLIASSGLILLDSFHLTSYMFWAWFMFCRFVLDWDISRE